MTVAEMQAEARADLARNNSPATQDRIRNDRAQAHATAVDSANLRRDGATQSGDRR